MKSRNEKIGTDSQHGSSHGSTTDYLKNMFSSNVGGAAGKSFSYGIKSVLAKSALRRLPPPLNFVAPLVAEKLIMAYGIDGGRDALLKGLKWIKKVTDEKPSLPVKVS